MFHSATLRGIVSILSSSMLEQHNFEQQIKISFLVVNKALEYKRTQEEYHWRSSSRSVLYCKVHPNARLYHIEDAQS